MRFGNLYANQHHEEELIIGKGAEHSGNEIVHRRFFGVIDVLNQTLPTRIIQVDKYVQGFAINYSPIFREFFIVTMSRPPITRLRINNLRIANAF